MMNRKIEQLIGLRQYLLTGIAGLNAIQLNHIPDRFNNNIVWNMAHLIAVQQMLCYVRADLQPAVEDRFVTPFLTGTKPERNYTEEEIGEIKTTLLSSVYRLEEDLGVLRSKSYTPSVLIPKVYGFEVRSIDEALEYLLFHEGQHIGYIQALKKLL